jgi:3'-phosphoadenosine 5'-phosphosulfate sulfotransferase (PAPS reductase)/FAD synthetase
MHKQKLQSFHGMYVITFSGGKDSLATLLWAKDNLKPDQWVVVFCDTGWESPLTYAHIKQIEEWIGKKFIFLKSRTYKNFIDLCIKKKRVASTKSRFCTEKLKTEPMIDYILDMQMDIIVVQGVRADESEARSTLKMDDEYFKFYFEPYGYGKSGKKKGKPLYHSYRKKEVVAHVDKYSVDVLRPILKWTAQEVFEYIFLHKLKANPLYYQGFSRVGCFPCVMCRHDEIKLIAEHYPERIDEIRVLEQTIGRTFFPPEYIPPQFCDRSEINKKGKRVYYATIDAIVKYVLDNPDQILLFPKQQGCISVYNICESPN